MMIRVGKVASRRCKSPAPRQAALPTLRLPVVRLGAPADALTVNGTLTFAEGR
jgi:hypothetical protein